MALAAWLVRRGISSPGRARTGTAVLWLWWLQLGLNLAWSLTFFGRRRPGWGLVVISILEVTIIATTVADGAEQQVGVARYVRGDTPETAHVAEFAVVIADAWQHRGVAHKLMRKLIDAAADAGVRQLADITLFDNVAMLALARKLGFKVRRDPGNPNVTQLRLALQAPAT